MNPVKTHFMITYFVTCAKPNFCPIIGWTYTWGESELSTCLYIVGPTSYTKHKNRIKKPHHKYWIWFYGPKHYETNSKLFYVTKMNPQCQWINATSLWGQAETVTNLSRTMTKELIGSIYFFSFLWYTERLQNKKQKGLQKTE